MMRIHSIRHVVWGLLGAVVLVAGFPIQPVSAQALSASSPTREYIYMGGRLLAVDSGGANGGFQPTGLVAAATTTTNVHLSWTAPSGVTVNHYQIERRATISGTATIITTSNSSVSYDDTVSAGTTYLYRVRTVDSGSHTGSYGNLDIATTVIFTDSTITAGTTAIKAAHISELRTAVDAVRTAAELSSSSWTDSSLSGVAAKRVHVQELRDSINAALSALVLSTPAFTDATLTAGTSTIKKVHIDELRQRVQ